MVFSTLLKDCLHAATETSRGPASPATLVPDVRCGMIAWRFSKPCLLIQSAIFYLPQMSPLPPEKLAATPPKPLLPQVPADTPNLTNLTRMQDVADPPHTATNKRERCTRSNAKKFGLLKRRSYMIGNIGVLVACLVLLTWVTNSRWSGKYQGAQTPHGNGDHGSFGIRGGDNAMAAARSALMNKEVNAKVFPILRGRQTCLVAKAIFKFLRILSPQALGKQAAPLCLRLP